MLNNAVAVLEASSFRLQARAWLAQVDSNHRPRAYQARALTTWAMSHCLFFWLPTRVGWWRWWDSNPWPPACRAGALPAELHPHRSNEIWGYISVSFPLPQHILSNRLFLGFCFSPFLKILKNWTKKCKRLRSSCFGIYLVLRYFRFSIERRWSSRTFRYGYLVTT